MIDIHCHLLHGVDDGAATEEISHELMNLAVRCGTRAIIATPHVIEAAQKPAWSVIVDRAASLAQYALDKQLPLQVYPGGELEVNADLLEIVQKDSDDYCLAGTSYVLVEFPASMVPEDTEEIFYQLQLKDKWPIIAHPERNKHVMSDMNRLLRWLRSGILLQCNAGSFTGLYGSPAQANAQLLLRNGLISFIGSDAHNTERRTTDMRAAAEAIEEQVGALALAELTVTNPQKLLNNKIFYLDVPKNPADLQGVEPTKQSQEGVWDKLIRRFTH